MHLFSADLRDRGGISVGSNDFALAGDEVIDPCYSPIGFLGLSISYDVRFPELYRQYTMRGAQVMLVPSAFHAKTGSSHWATLLRSRAIEN